MKRCIQGIYRETAVRQVGIKEEERRKMEKRKDEKKRGGGG